MNTITITMDGGIIQDVEIDCEVKVKVVVKDYDIDGLEDNICTDENGDFQEFEFEN